MSSHVYGTVSLVAFTALAWLVLGPIAAAATAALMFGAVAAITASDEAA